MGKFCYGVDVGGTTVKIGRFDPDGNVQKKWEIKTRSQDGGKDILPDIIQALRKDISDEKLETPDLIGIGIGIPAPVSEDGVVESTANLGWKQRVEVSSTLSKAFYDVPVKAGNDANVAALGEMWKGGGTGHRNGVLVTLGTGVGGGIIIDNEILTGAHGAGGEIGHIHVENEEKDKCGCGNRGCLEQYAAAPGIVKLGKKMLEADSRPSPLRDQEVSAKSIFDQVKEGDPVAMDIAEAFGKYLGTALGSIAAVLDPGVFIIGGGVSKAGQVLIDYIKKYYVDAAFFACKEVDFTLAELGNDAGIYGAAKLILNTSA